VGRKAALDLISGRIAKAGSLGGGEVNTLGVSSAPIHVVQFQDVQCGMCRRSYKRMFVQLHQELIDSGKVKYTFMEYPLIRGGQEDVLAQALKCAGEQGKYLTFLDYIYTMAEAIRSQEADAIAMAVGLDQGAFSACMLTKRYRAAVDADIELGASLGVDGTPIFFVNGVQIQGALEYADMKRIIDTVPVG
jgi:protein-disulfide isomerase